MNISKQIKGKRAREEMVGIQIMQSFSQPQVADCAVIIYSLWKQLKNNELHFSV